MTPCTRCGHDRDDHRWGESWCTTTGTIGQGSQPCDCSEFIDPDAVEDAA